MAIKFEVWDPDDNLSSPQVIDSFDEEEAAAAFTGAPRTIMVRNVVTGTLFLFAPASKAGEVVRLTGPRGISWLSFRGAV